MALLSNNRRGLLGAGPLAIMQAAANQRAGMAPARAPSVIPASSTVIREENPLNTIGDGLAKLARGVFGDPEIRARREAMAKALEPVETVSQMIQTSPGAPGPGPSSAPIYQAEQTRFTPTMQSQTLLDPAAIASARAEGYDPTAPIEADQIYRPRPVVEVKSQTRPSDDVVARRLSEMGRQDLASDYLNQRLLFGKIKSLEEAARKEATIERLRKEAGQAMQSGDYGTAMSLLTQINPAAVSQALAQKAFARPRLVANGMFTERADGTLEPNDLVIAANERVARAQAQARLSANPQMLENQIEDADAIEQLTSVISEINELEDLIDDGLLVPGLVSGAVDSVVSTIGVGPEQFKRQAEARNQLNRFETRYVNKVLSLMKGVQTEGDAQRAFKELTSGNTKEGMKRVLQELERKQRLAIEKYKKQMKLRQDLIGG